jgi:hypothetical protein
MKYQTPDREDIANRFTILRTQVGSGLYGVTVEDTDDRDEMGICVEPKEYVLGLKRFDQYEFRTQPQHVRSGPGDLDLNVYGLRKWMRLALDGNPTVIMPLFAPKQDTVTITHWGRVLRSNHAIEHILSKQITHKFLGYLHNQRLRMLGLKSQHTNRPELIAEYGFDTKFAYHAVRLGFQGHELLSTGRITLPIPEPQRTLLHHIRTGVYTLDEVLSMIEDWELDIQEAIEKSPLRTVPDRDWANGLMATIYEATWEGAE